MFKETATMRPTSLSSKQSVIGKKTLEHLITLGFNLRLKKFDKRGYLLIDRQSVKVVFARVGCPDAVNHRSRNLII